MSHSIKRFIRIVLVSSLLVLTLASGLNAAPVTQAEGTPIDDAAVLIESYGGPVDNSGLYLVWSQGPDAATQKPIGYAILKFDLTGGSPGGLAWPSDLAIGKARLNLYAPTCLSQDSGVAVALYGMPDAFDGWTEGSLPTFEATEAAAAQLLVAGADEGGIVPPGYYHWTDSGSGTFASWLESQKTSGTYPGIVTLMLKIPASTSTVVIGFDDKELSSGCPPTGVPMLQLADADQPLTVTLSDLSTDNAAPTLPLYAGLGAVALIVVAGLAISRRRIA